MIDLKLYENPALYKKLEAIVYHGTVEELMAEAGAGGCAVLGPYGGSLLNYAARFGREDFARFLIEEAKLPVNQPDKSGDTPLHEAARSGTAAIVQLLLENGADAYLGNNNGQMPLNYAENSSSAASVALLREELKKPKWYKTADDEVSRVREKELLNCRLTEVFNFTDRSYILMTQSRQTKNETVNLRSFAELADTTLVQQAEEAFTRLGGTLPNDYTGKLDKSAVKAPSTGRGGLAR